MRNHRHKAAVDSFQVRLVCSRNMVEYDAGIRAQIRVVMESMILLLMRHTREITKWCKGKSITGMRIDGFPSPQKHMRDPQYGVKI